MGTMSFIRCGCQTGEQYSSCDLTGDRQRTFGACLQCERFFSVGVVLFKALQRKVCSCSDVPSKVSQTLINRGHDVMTCMI